MFQYQAIDRLEQPPTIWTLKGTLVHAALEGLFTASPEHRSERSRPRAAPRRRRGRHVRRGARRASDWRARPPTAFVDDAASLVRNYFELEDPARSTRSASSCALETTLEIGGGLEAVPLRGIIDRLDRDEHGDLVVVDYKTGRAPGPGRERSKLAGVETYALLCERVLGVRPVAVRLLYLRAPLIVEREVAPRDGGAPGAPSRRGVAGDRQGARGGIVPALPGPLCSYCAFADRCEGALRTGVGGRTARSSS